MKRVLALAAAVALVAGAVFLRGALDDDGTDVTSGPDTTNDGTPLVVACAPELRAVCNALVRADDVLFLTPDQVLARMEAGNDLDAWITLDPWPAVLAFDAGFDDAFARQQVVVASTDLVLATRVGALSGDCAAAPDWDCAVAAGAGAGRAAVPAMSTTLGPLALGWATLEWSQVSGQERLSRGELSERPFRQWLSALDLGKPDPLGEALLLRTAGPPVLAATAADFTTRVEGSVIAGSYEAGGGARPATVAVVVAGPAAQRVAGEPTLAQLLEDAGWTPGDQPSSGLPDAGLLFALRQEASR